jgi:hypothetical protein
VTVLPSAEQHDCALTVTPPPHETGTAMQLPGGEQPAQAWAFAERAQSSSTARTAMAAPSRLDQSMNRPTVTARKFP